MYITAENIMPLTPAIEFMIREKFLDAPSPAALAKLLSRGMMKDLLDQIGHTISTFRYEDHVDPPEMGVFRATLGPSLDPFSPRGKCMELPCRITMAQQFARSIALYVDHAIVADPVTSVFLSEEPPSIAQLSHMLFPRLAVLKVLLPLVEVGVVRFAAGMRLICRHCMKERDRLTEQGIAFVEGYLKERGLQIEIAPRGSGARVSVRCPEVLGSGPHELIGSYAVNKNRAKPLLALLRGRHRRGSGKGIRGEQLNGYIRTFVASQVDHVMFDMQTATMSGSAFLSGSRVETVFLSFLEGTAPPMAEVERWESLRSIELPAVNRLSVSEILQLRGEASAALVQLRSLLAKRLSAPENVSTASVDIVVRDLQAQAMEVERELRIYRKPSARGTEVGIVTAAIMLVLYGASTRDPATTATALAGALATLATMHVSSQEASAKVERLKRQAPYVLVHAKQLLSHRR